MKLEQQADLFSHNTMRLHCIADSVYYPETYDELLMLLKRYAPKYHLLAAGSNVILPPLIHQPVISLMQINNRLEILEDGRVYVGCSVRVQKLIRFLQDNNLGGIEYLFSVPASLGGVVYMNGGRGREHNKSISDYLDSVDYLDLNDFTVKTYYSNKKDFSYRHSPFQDMNAIILAANFKFIKQMANTTESLIRERINYSKKYLSADKPSCGTAFCKGNRYVFRLLRGMRIGGAMFSKKTSNWISNVDNATYEDICKLIRRTERIHKLILCDCQPEIKIVKE